MPKKYYPSPRSVAAFIRFRNELPGVLGSCRLNKGRKPGPLLVATVNRLVLTANRIFARQPDIPPCAPLPTGRPLLMSDVTLLMASLEQFADVYRDRYDPLIKASEDPYWEDDYDFEEAPWPPSPGHMQKHL